MGISRFHHEEGPGGINYLKDDCFRVRCDLTVSKEIRTEVTSQFVTVPPSDMNQHIGRLLSSVVEADVTFQVSEETFAAHRLVLGARSSVSMAELFGPIKERNSSLVQIDDIEPRVFRAMLHFIYTDALPEMDKGDIVAMAQHLLVAADRYDLQRLKLMCEHKLCECINTSTATTTLVLAEQHGCKGLKEACFKFLKSPCNLKKIMDSDEFQHLTSSCPSLLDELLANVAA
jgi:speckle-type POZ protein